MKIAIFGAGSLGSILGAYISKSGKDVDLIRRNQEHIKAFNTKGVQVVGKANFTEKVQALTPGEMDSKYDLIILATKQNNNHEVVPFLSNYLKNDGILCTIQNGLPEPGIAEFLNEDKIIGAIVEWGASMKGPGVSELTSDKESMSFTIGRINERIDSKVKRLAKILESMCPVHISDNFLGMRWYKLLLNSAFGTTSSALGASLGRTIKNKKSRSIVQAVSKEVIDTARAANISIPKTNSLDIVELLDYNNKKEKESSYKNIARMMPGHENSKASLLQDLEKGIPTEILFLNGVIKDYGEKYNIETPFNNRSIEIIQAIEKNNLKAEFENVNLYKDLF